METLDKCMQDWAQIIEKHPLLTRKEEVELAKTIKKFKTGKRRQEAREQLYFSNLKLVLQRAYAAVGKSNLPIEDLITAGVEGLGLAIDRFKPSIFKTKFSTIATYWIDLKIGQAMIASYSDVYIPRHIRNKNRKFKDLISNNTPAMTDKEIMKKLKVSSYVLGNIHAANSSSIVSLDNNFGNDNDPTSTLKETIADTKAKSPYVCCAEKDRKALLQKYLNQLDPLSKEILYCRYINDDKEGLNAIGRRYGLSGERIRQISESALKKMQKKVRDRTSFEV